MLFPIIASDGAFLVEISCIPEPGIRNNRLEDFLVDADAVNAVFEAFTAFAALTGTLPDKELYISSSSAIELERRQCRIAGDSMGLAVLMLLLQDATGFKFSIKKACAATGALVVEKDKVLCRQVGHLGAKLECLEFSEVDILYCPAQVDAPNDRYKSVLVKQISAIKQDLNSPYFQMEFA